MGAYTTGKHPQPTSQNPLVITIDLTAATTTTAGGVVSIANPAGVDLIITDALLDITTAATTSANTIDAGVAANATTSSDTLFDGQTTTAGVKAPGGTNGGVRRVWGASQVVTATASASLAGMVGTITLLCARR